MTRLVKVQLVIFLVLTLVGVTYAGARYAGLAGLVGADRTFHVEVELAESGGIFKGADVTYRGISVGRVGDLELTTNGVRVGLDLESGTEVPSDTLAVVENRSAIGEQYVDLQPRRKGAPYLEDGATIARADTQTPIPTTKLLSNLDRLVGSVDKKDLAVVVDELGTAFWGTGDDLGRIIDSGNALIETADANLTQTIALIRDAKTVLQTQRDSGGAIRSFAKDLADLSDTLVEVDPQLRKVLDDGIATADQLDGLMSDLEGDLPILLSNLTSTGEVIRARLDGVEQLLIVYPYVVRGGFTVIDKDPGTGRYTTHFGLQLRLGPSSCLEGYEGTKRRMPEDVKERPANQDARCTDTETNHRGAQNAPEPGGVPESPDRDADADTGSGTGSGSGSGSGSGTGPQGAAGAGGAAAESSGTGSSVVEPATVRPNAGGLARETFGKEAWKWLLLGPTMM